MKTVALFVGCGALAFLAMMAQTGLLEMPTDNESGNKKAVAENKPRSTSGRFPEDLAPACAGKSVPKAADYRFSSRCHPLVFLYATGELHEDWQEYLAPEWRAHAVEETELVVIVGEDRFELDVCVRAARYGTELARTRFRSVAQPVSFTTVFKWLASQARTEFTAAPAPPAPAAPEAAPPEPRKAAAAPPPGRWTVLFRGDDPAVWGTHSRGQQYAVPLHEAPARFNYLRLHRMDTGQALVVPLTRDQLENGEPPARAASLWWNGTAREDWKGRHLGIVQGPRRYFPPPKGMIAVMTQGWDAFTGSGFGHKCFANDRQYYCWLGEEIPRTVFEIAVSDERTPDDRPAPGTVLFKR